MVFLQKVGIIIQQQCYKNKLRSEVQWYAYVLGKGLPFFLPIFFLYLWFLRKHFSFPLHLKNYKTIAIYFFVKINGLKDFYFQLKNGKNLLVRFENTVIKHRSECLYGGEFETIFYSKLPVIEIIFVNLLFF